MSSKPEEDDALVPIEDWEKPIHRDVGNGRAVGFPRRREDKLRNLAHAWRAEAETAHVDTASLLLEHARQVEEALL